MTDSTVSRATAVFSARDESGGVVKKATRETKDYAAAVATVNTRHDQATKRAKDSAAAQRELLKQRRQQLAAANAQIRADRQNSRITVDEAKKRRAAIADELAALRGKELEITKQERRRVGRIEKMRRQSRAAVEATNNERAATQRKIETERRAYAAWSSQTNQRIGQEDKLRRAINSRVSAEVDALRRMGGRQRGDALINRPGGRVSNAATIAAVAGGSAVMLGGARAQQMQAAHAGGGGGIFAAGGRQRGGGRYDTSNQWRSAFGAAAAGSAIFSAAAPVLGGILVGRAIRGGVRAMGDYEDAVVDLQKVLRGTAEEQERVVESVTALADAMPNTREELLRMGAAGAQMGVAARDVAKFTSAMQKLISAAPTITEAEALQFGQTKSFLGSGVGYQELAGIITEIGNTQPVTESRILEMIHQVSGGLGTLRGQAGLSSADVAGIGGYLGSVGARPESARTTIREWTQAWLEALAGAEDKMESFAKVTGKTEEQLREMSSVEVMGAFLKGMNRLGVSSKALLDEIGLGGDRALAVLSAMGLRVDDFYASVKSANEQVAKGGVAVDKEFAARAETMRARFQIVNNWWAEWTESSTAGASALAAAYETVTEALIGPQGENKKSWMRAEVEKISEELENIERMRGVFGGDAGEDSAHQRGLRRRRNELREGLGIFSGGANPLEASGMTQELREQIQEEIERGLSVQQNTIFGLTGLADPAAPKAESDAEKSGREVLARLERARQEGIAAARAAALARERAAAGRRSGDYWAENAEAQARFDQGQDRLEGFWYPENFPQRGGGGPPGRGRNYHANLRRNLPYGPGRRRLHAEQDFEIDRIVAQEAADMAATQADYNKELAKSVTFADGFVGAMRRVESAALLSANSGREAFEGLSDAIGDTMRIAVEDGKLSLDSLKSHFLTFALELTTKNLFQHALAPALSSALSFGATPTTYTPNFAAGGNAAPGFIRVGEQGPETLMLSSPGRVYSAAQTRAMENGGGRNGGITVNFNGPLSNNDVYGQRLVASAVEGAVVAVRQIQSKEFQRGGEV